MASPFLPVYFLSWQWAVGAKFMHCTCFCRGEKHTWIEHRNRFVLWRTSCLHSVKSLAVDDIHLKLQVGLSLHCNASQSQWANLTALHRTPCLWRPSKCTSGATLAMWIKTRQREGGFEGIFSTIDEASSRERWRLRWTDTGDLKYMSISMSQNFCLFGQWAPTKPAFECAETEKVHQLLLLFESELFQLVHFRFIVATKTALYGIKVGPISYDWIHMVLVYYGPEDGISMYINGSLVKSNLSGAPRSFGETSGNVVLCRDEAMKDKNYADVMVDELYFWNQPLGAAVVEEIYESYWHLMRGQMCSIKPSKTIGNLETFFVSNLLSQQFPPVNFFSQAPFFCPYPPESPHHSDFCPPPPPTPMRLIRISDRRDKHSSCCYCCSLWPFSTWVPNKMTLLLRFSTCRTPFILGSQRCRSCNRPAQSSGAEACCLNRLHTCHGVSRQ